MRINFIDPGLNEGAGHHYAHAEIMIKGMAAHGHKVILYCHKTIHNHIRDRLDEICRVVPIFDTFPYPRYFGEKIEFDQQVQSLSREYEIIGPADIWFFPSLFPFQLKALASRTIPIKMFGCLHSFFEEDRWAGSLEATDHHVRHLASFEKVITEGIKSLAKSGKFSVLPVLEFCDPIPSAKSSLETVGFFGGQKQSKGQELIHGIIDELLKRGTRVLLQDAWDRFKVHRDGVENIGFVDSLSDVMRRCDLLIFPYNVREYSRRMSAVLNFGLHLGIPCIVPLGTTLADKVPDPSCRFIETNVVEIIKTFDKVSEDYNHISEIFFENALAMNKNNLDEFLRISLS